MTELGSTRHVVIRVDIVHVRHVDLLAIQEVDHHPALQPRPAPQLQRPALPRTRAGTCRGQRAKRVLRETSGMLPVQRGAAGGG